MNIEWFLALMAKAIEVNNNRVTSIAYGDEHGAFVVDFGAAYAIGPLDLFTFSQPLFP